MYDELVKRLRDAATISKALAVLLPHSEGNATAKLYNEAADAIEELQQNIEQYKLYLQDAINDLRSAHEKEPEWIPVTEAPKLKVGDEGYTGYLVYANGFYEIGDYTTDKFGNFEYFHVDGELETDVTHYMPLPEPPKER